MAEEKKLSFKEIKEFFKERRLDPLHTSSSYHCLDGAKVTTDVGYFEDCMENGFLRDLELFMTGRNSDGGSGGHGPLYGDAVSTAQCIGKCGGGEGSVCYAGAGHCCNAGAGPLHDDIIFTPHCIRKCSECKESVCYAGGRCWSPLQHLSAFTKNDK